MPSDDQVNYTENSKAHDPKGGRDTNTNTNTNAKPDRTIPIPSQNR